MSAIFETLATSVAAQDGLDRRLEVLLQGLADRIKASSNDQNVQRLSRELRAAGPVLSKVITGASL